MALFKGLFANKKYGENQEAEVPSSMASIISKTRNADGRIELQINVATPENPQEGTSSTAPATDNSLAALTQETSANINNVVNAYEDLFEEEDEEAQTRALSEEPDEEVICNQRITGNSGKVYNQKDVYNAKVSLALLRQTKNVLDMNHSHLKLTDVRNKQVLEKYHQALLCLNANEKKAMDLITDMKQSTQFNWVTFLRDHARKQQYVLRSGDKKGKKPLKSSGSDSSKSGKKTNKSAPVPDVTQNDPDPDDDPSSDSSSSDNDSDSDDDDFQDAQLPNRTPQRRSARTRSSSRDTSRRRDNDMPLVKFDGKEDVAGWIHQMELTQDDMGWSDRKLCRVALRCLDKKAAVWLQTLHQRGFTFSHWKGSDGLKKKLETRFGESTKGVGRTYQTMLQRQEESAEDFYDRASQAVALRDRKWKRSYLESQRDLCGVLLGGFPQHMLDAIGDKLEDQSDPEKMLRLAKAYEKKKNKKAQNHQHQGKQKNKNTNATSAKTDNWCRKCPDADHYWKDCPAKKKGKQQQQQTNATQAETSRPAKNYREDFRL